MTVTLIYIIGSALETFVIKNVTKIKTNKKYLKIWSGIRFWKEPLKDLKSFTVKPGEKKDG